MESRKVCGRLILVCKGSSTVIDLVTGLIRAIARSHAYAVPRLSKPTTRLVCFPAWDLQPDPWPTCALAPIIRCATRDGPWPETRAYFRAWVSVGLSGLDPPLIVCALHHRRCRVGSHPRVPCIASVRGGSGSRLLASAGLADVPRGPTNPPAPLVGLRPVLGVS